MGYVVFLVVAIAIAFLLFHPALKGTRTLIAGWLTTIGLGIVPLLTQVTDYLKELDWRQYVLSWQDKQNFLILAIPTGLGVLFIILRYMTTGPVGTKQ